MAQVNPTAMFITIFSPAPGCLTMATQQLQNKNSTRDHHFLSASTFELSTALQVALEDFRAAQTRVRPSAMREVALELPRVAWGDVGGLDAIKQRLKEAVEWPQKHPELLRRLGAKASPVLPSHDV